MSAGSWQARVGWGPGSRQTPREGGDRGSSGLPVHARSSAGSLSGFLCQMGRGVLFLPEPRLAHVGMYTLLPGSVTLCSPGLRVLASSASAVQGEGNQRSWSYNQRWDGVTVQRRDSGPAGVQPGSSAPWVVTKPPLQPCPRVQ